MLPQLYCRQYLQHLLNGFIYGSFAIFRKSFVHPVGHYRIYAQALMAQQLAHAVNGAGFHFKVDYLVLSVAEVSE